MKFCSNCRIFSLNAFSLLKNPFNAKNILSKKLKNSLQFPPKKKHCSIHRKRKIKLKHIRTKIWKLKKPHKWLHIFILFLWRNWFNVIGCIQIIPLGVPKRGNYPFRGGSKLWWQVSGPSLGMNPRSSALAQWVALDRR